MQLMDLPEYSEVRDISLKDEKALTELLKAFQPQISEYIFTNLFAWRNSKRCLLSSIEGEPLILRVISGVRYLMPRLQYL